MQIMPGVAHFWNEQTSIPPQQTAPQACCALQHNEPAQMPPFPQGSPSTQPASPPSMKSPPPAPLTLLAVAPPPEEELAPVPALVSVAPQEAKGAAGAVMRSPMIKI